MDNKGLGRTSRQRYYLSQMPQRSSHKLLTRDGLMKPQNNEWQPTSYTGPQIDERPGYSEKASAYINNRRTGYANMTTNAGQDEAMQAQSTRRGNDALEKWEKKSASMLHMSMRDDRGGDRGDGRIIGRQNVNEFDATIADNIDKGNNRDHHGWDFSEQLYDSFIWDNPYNADYNYQSWTADETTAEKDAHIYIHYPNNYVGTHNGVPIRQKNESVPYGGRPAHEGFTMKKSGIPYKGPYKQHTTTATAGQSDSKRAPDTGLYSSGFLNDNGYVASQEDKIKYGSRIGNIQPLRAKSRLANPQGNVNYKSAAHWYDVRSADRIRARGYLHKRNYDRNNHEAFDGPELENVIRSPYRGRPMTTKERLNADYGLNFSCNS